MDLLKVYQIYFDQSQIPLLDFTPYDNTGKCTVYFENSVIVELLDQCAHKDAEYFGVVSYKLREKMGQTRNVWKPESGIHSVSERIFTKEDFEKELCEKRPDVMSFQSHIPHDTIATADNFHPNFQHYFKAIMDRLGYLWKPTKFENVFYCNYFVAKSSIYQHYVDTMLRPAMRIMDTMPGLMQDANYSSELPDNLKKSFGINHYPYHAFICERMFSYYVHLNKLSCLHY